MAKKDSGDPRAAKLSAKDKAKLASNGKQTKAEMEKDVKALLKAQGGTEERGAIATFFFGPK
jgi:hypothetical protein